MKKTIVVFVLLFSAVAATAQKNFEGVLVYKDNVTSKKEEISNNSWKKILHVSDQVTVLVKDGNFRHSSDKTEAYVFPTKGRSYYKFKGYDTLYYLDVSSDTGTVISVTKNAAKKMITGYNCNSIMVQTSAGANTYFYSPSIYMDPALTQNYKRDREDVFYKETSSLYLGLQQETDSYIFSESCIKVEPKAIDAASFDLPNLPQAELKAASFIKSPEFKGKEGWSAYLSKQVDATVAAKYVKMKRSEDAASETVMVSFTVSESGGVYDVTVTNKKEVHPKLAEEAMRVISMSRWLPATVFGESIPYKMTQPITFQVVKQ
jgi:TonB family protein